MLEIRHKKTGQVLFQLEGNGRPDLERANIAGADLHGARLAGADLRESLLAGTDLDRVVCDGSTRWPESCESGTLDEAAEAPLAVFAAPTQQ